MTMNDNETKRLAALERYAILDSVAEKAYDDVVQLASFICQTPIALVSFVDSKRQWFKARLGISASETPREYAFCAHAIRGNDLMEVQNALLDERFKTNPLVVGEPKIRFYAGAPLIVPSGDALGTLCVIDTAPRKLSPEQAQALESLARQVVYLLELRAGLATLEERNHDLESALTELKSAKSQLETQQQAIVYSAKMAALGEMAAGVAHEINNPLAIILARARQLRTAMERGEGRDIALNYLERIEATGQRIVRIISGLRNFARDGNHDAMSEAKAEALVEETLDFCRERFRVHGVDLRWQSGVETTLSCRPVQIAQVLLNLLNNAFDAVFGKDQAWVELRLESDADTVRFVVTDSGHGISAADQGKLFQPFFTTKPPNAGTGLGLSIAKGIVEAHGGQLYYDTKESHTCFVVVLPKSQDQDRIDMLGPLRQKSSAA